MYSIATSCACYLSFTEPFPKSGSLTFLRFALFHPEKLESAQGRYANELKRVVGVLDPVLKGNEWLVGDKCTYADLVFVMWNTQIDFTMKGHEWNIAVYPIVRSASTGPMSSGLKVLWASFARTWWTSQLARSDTQSAQ